MKIATIVAALAALLIGASSAEATVYSGSVSDGANDLGLFGGDNLPSPPTSFTGVSVRHDDLAGRVDVSYTFTNAPAFYQRIEAGVGLGVVQPNGSCSAPFFSSLGWHPSSGNGEVAVIGTAQNFGGTVRGGTLWDYDAGWESASAYEWPGFANVWHFSTNNIRLIGQRYNCGYAAMWIADGDGGPGNTGPAEDFLDVNYFGISPGEPPTPETPSARWQNPKEGATVTGLLSEGGTGAHKCLVKVVGPVARTENYVDGKLSDTQVYSPWGCEIDTRDYVNGGHLLTVKALDKKGDVIATDTVRVIVDNAKPPAKDDPPPPRVEPKPGPTGPTGPQGPAGPGGDSGGNPTVDLPPRRLSMFKARRAVLRSIERRYGDVIGTGSYRASCVRRGPKAVRCRVSWRFGDTRYRGTVRARLRLDGLGVATSATIRSKVVR